MQLVTFFLNYFLELFPLVSGEFSKMYQGIMTFFKGSLGYRNISYYKLFEYFIPYNLKCYYICLLISWYLSIK